MASRMLITINIRKYLVTQPRNKRARKAARYIRERVSHFTKTSIDNVRLSQELNSLIAKRISRKMVPVKLSVKIEEGKATAEPFSTERSGAAQGKAEQQKAAQQKK